MINCSTFAKAALAAGIAVTVVAGATLASAAPPSAAATIGARQANFKKMGAAMKAVKDEVAGGGDKAKMVAAARTLAAMARAQGPLFPAGTGPGAGVKTDALPAIWAQRAAFDASARKLVADADRLVAAAASGNTAAVGAQFKVVGATCSACHRQFRADN